MRNLIVVVAWHGGSPKVSTSCTDPRGSTLSPENPRRQALTSSSYSLPMPILSKVDVGRASVVDKDPVDRFISYYGFYYKRVVMGMLAAFHVEV